LSKSLLDLSHPWEDSRQNIRRKLKCWMDNRHLARWQGLSSTQRQAQELISGPCLAAKIRLLYFNKIKSRVVIGTLNPLTPNDHYSGRTATLTSKLCILYIYSTNIGTEYFKHGIYSPFFSLQNAACFIILMCLVPVLFTSYIQVC
jgi:hypothetical protein